MITSISTKPIYNTAPTPEIVKNEFAEIIAKLGKEAAQEKCWKRVTEQKNGKDVLIAAKVFSDIYPSSTKEPTRFEFADNTTLSLSSSQLEALKKDSRTISDLLDDAEGNHIPLTQISRLQFLALLNILYPTESFEKAALKPLDIVLAANYLDIKEVLDSFSKQFKAQIAAFKDENDLSKALVFYKSIKGLPKDIREPLELEMGAYFGAVLSKASLEKRGEIIKQYDECRITALSFRNNNNVILNDLSQISSLRILDLSFTDLINENIQDIPSGLTSLNLSNCDQITDEGLEKLPKDLTSLDLRHCTKITDKGLSKLPHGLASLDLRYCNQITDEGIGKLPQGLASLDLRYCAQITDEGLGKLPKGLTSLDLTECDQITDEGLSMLPKGLTSLDLSFCAQITDKGLSMLPKGLTSLKLFGCHQITDGKKNALRQRGIEDIS